MIGFLAFLLYPILQSVVMVFSDVGLDLVNHRFSLKFSGFENLKRVFFVDPEFNRLLVNELWRVVLIVPAVILFSLFAALLLNQQFRGRSFVRAVFFLPVILSSGAIIGLEANNSLLSAITQDIRKTNMMLTSVTDVLEDILIAGGMASNFFQYIFVVVNQIYTIVMASGIQIIIFLSGIQTIPPSLYEAAEIEGAAKWECFWKITFPMVSPLILVNVVYSVVDFFLRTDNQVMSKIQKTFMVKMEYSFSTAMSWAYFAAVFVVLGVVYLVVSRAVYYYD
jgi:ABC-type sugar transport system permease subunit